MTACMFGVHYSYSMSAKTGSKVVATFHRIAADLSGVNISNEYLRSIAGQVQVPLDEHVPCVVTTSYNASSVERHFSRDPSASDNQQEQGAPFQPGNWFCKSLFGVCMSKLRSWIRCLGMK